MMDHVWSVPSKGSPPPPFIVTRRAGAYEWGRGSRRFPPNRGVQWPNTVESTLWGMASGAAVVLDIVLGLAEIAPAPCQPSRRRGHRCRAYSSGGILRALQVKVLRAPAGVGHAAVLNPLDGVQARAPGSPGDTWRPRTPRGGSGTPAAGDGHPSSRGPWRHRTPSRAGGGPGAMRMMRQSPDGRSWQNRDRNCAERVLSRVAGSTVPPQRPGWRSSDRR